MRERLIRQPPRRAVLFPPGCRCGAQGAEECREYERLKAIQHGGEPKPEGACECVCRTLEPSPWDWDQEEE